MPRRYDSKLRRAGAEATRARIIETAVRLHGEGVTDLEPLAEAAGVSLPTVRKHFPTKERLFQACTATTTPTYASRLDPAELLAITGRAERVAAVVRRVHALMEWRFGQLWTAYQLAARSPVMADTLRGRVAGTGRLLDALVESSVADPARRPVAASLAKGLLSALTYRALRLEAGMTPDEATAHVTELLLFTFGIAPHSANGGTKR